MLVLALILAQAPMSVGPIYSSPSTMQVASYAAFEFAPSNGMGLGTACACNPIAGARGETITLTRASAATCSSLGLATIGITTTSMIICDGGVPRVEPGLDGVLGLRVERASTNVLLRSEEINNAAWTSAGTGVAVPTVTADQAVTPWGTLTAERMVFPATASGQESIKYQAGTVGQPVACFAYVRGAGDAGTINLGINNGTTCSLQRCDYPGADAGTWTQCKVTHTAGSAANFLIGNESTAFCGSVATGYNDVYVTGLQCEAAKFSTSYIPTTSAAVTRAADSYTFGAGALPAAAYSKAATISTTWSDSTATPSPSILAGGITTASGSDFTFATLGLRAINYAAGTNGITSAPLSIDAGTAMRLAVASTGTAATLYRNGVAILTAPLDAGLTPNSATTSIATGLDGIITRICWDADPARCLQ